MKTFKMLANVIFDIEAKNEDFANFSSAEDNLFMNRFATSTALNLNCMEFFWKSLTILSSRDFGKRHEDFPENEEI